MNVFAGTGVQPITATSPIMSAESLTPAESYITSIQASSQICEGIGMDAGAIVLSAEIEIGDNRADS